MNEDPARSERTVAHDLKITEPQLSVRYTYLREEGHTTTNGFYHRGKPFGVIAYTLYPSVVGGWYVRFHYSAARQNTYTGEGDEFEKSVGRQKAEGRLFSNWYFYTFVSEDFPKNEKVLTAIYRALAGGGDVCMIGNAPVTINVFGEVQRWKMPKRIVLCAKQWLARNKTNE